MTAVAMKPVRKRFQKVNLEISNICNLQCSFCPEVVRPKERIDVDFFRRLIPQLAPLTEQVTFHLMGDPLVHSELATLVEICGEAKLPIFLVTNGVLLRENHAELLLHRAFRQVNFSLHSYADNFGDRDPTAYLEKIFSYTERALAERPELYLNYRLWNLGDPRGGGADNQRVLTAIENRFGVSVPRDFDVRRQKSYRVAGRLYLHYDTEFTWPSLDLPLIGESGRCHGLSSHFGILVDGTVVPCCLDKEAKIPLGNAHETPLLEILDGPRARAILDGFRNRKLVEALCQRCPYIERFA